MIVLCAAPGHADKPNVMAAMDAVGRIIPDVTVSKILGHARTSTTTDLYAHLRASDASTAAVAVSVAVKQAREASPTKARPEGFEPPTDRFVECVPGCALTYRFCAWRGCCRTGASRVVAG